MSYELRGLGRLGIFGQLGEETYTLQPVPCPDGSHDDGRGGCVWNTNSGTITGTQQATVKCKPGLVPDASGRYCVPAPGTQPQATSSCPPGSFPVGSDCYVCPGGSHWDGAQGCICDGGGVWSNELGTCLPPGVVPATSGCPAGQVKDPTGTVCIPALPSPGVPQQTPPLPNNAIACPPGSVWNGKGCVPQGVQPPKPPPQPQPAPPAPHQAGLMQSPLFWTAVVALTAYGLYSLSQSRPHA